MIRSMTAFAMREASTPFGQMSCELRSVNHRFLEVSLRLPEELRALEPRLREAIAARAGRGKVDASMRLRAAEGGGPGLRLNEAMARELTRLATEVKSLAPDLAAVFDACRHLGLEDLATTAPLQDLAHAHHDRLYSRLFAS